MVCADKTGCVVFSLPLHSPFVELVVCCEEITATFKLKLLRKTFTEIMAVIA